MEMPSIRFLKITAGFFNYVWRHNVKRSSEKPNPFSDDLSFGCAFMFLCGKLISLQGGIRAMESTTEFAVR